MDENPYKAPQHGNPASDLSDEAEPGLAGRMLVWLGSIVTSVSVVMGGIMKASDWQNIGVHRAMVLVPNAAGCVMFLSGYFMHRTVR